MLVVHEPEEMVSGELLVAVDGRLEQVDLLQLSKKIRRPCWVARDNDILPVVAFELWMLTNRNIEPGPCWVSEVQAQLMNAGHAMPVIAL